MTIFGRLPNLTLEQVIEIREWHKAYSTLLTWKGVAKKYNVSVQCVRDAVFSDRKHHE